MNKYKIEKYNSYYKKNGLKKLLVDFLPLFILKILFPLIGKFKIKKNSNVLDIGSGNGFYSYIIHKKFNCNVIEIEPSLDNDFYKSKRVKKDFLSWQTSSKYDYILLLDVLEHIDTQNSDGVIKKIKSCMHSESLLFVKVPNTGSFFGSESSFGDTTHVRYFSHLSLTSLFKINNFELIHMNLVKDNFNIGRFIARVLSYPIFLLFYIFIYSRGLSKFWSEPSILGTFKISDFK